MNDNGLHQELRARKKVSGQLYDALNPVYDPVDDGEPGTNTKADKVKPPSPYSVQNILWLISSIAVFYYTDLARAALYDTRVKRTWLHVGLILLAINLCIAFLLIVYLSWYKKCSSDEWDNHYPAAIPIATACFAFGSFCITIGLWPLWGAFTIPILFSQFMGLVVLIAMCPDF